MGVIPPLPGVGRPVPLGRERNAYSRHPTRQRASAAASRLSRTPRRRGQNSPGFTDTNPGALLYDATGKAMISADGFAEIGAKLTF